MQQQALASSETLAAAKPESAELAWTVMMQHAVTGAVAYRVGDTTLATTSTDRAIAMGERLLQADPENAQWRYDLSLCLALAGDLAAEREPRAALTLLERSLGLSQPLAARDPADVDVAGVVALAQGGLATAHAGLALASPRGAGAAASCSEARRWEATSAAAIDRLVRLQNLSGWRRWMARRVSAVVSRCP